MRLGSAAEIMHANQKLSDLPEQIMPAPIKLVNSI